MEEQSHTEVVHAPIDVCFQTIVDFEMYAKWFSGITAARLCESNPEAGTWTVAYELDMTLKTLRYTLAYKSEGAHDLTWKLVEGDVTDVAGSYTFRDLGDGTTEATCSQAIEIGFWIPGPIKRTFERSALADSVREFKKAAEGRARS